MTLTDNPEAPVLIVGSQKSAKAAKALAKSYVVYLWEGLAYAHLDTIRNRKVLIWLDDDPHASGTIGRWLSEYCPEIKAMPCGKNAWTIADAAAAGWDWSRITEWARSRVEMVKPSPNGSSPNGNGHRGTTEEIEALRMAFLNDVDARNERAAMILEDEPGPDEPPTPAQSIAESRYIESAEHFLSVEDPPQKYLVDELLPAGVLALLHGEPRTRKTWTALEIVLAVATGTAAFGLARFTAPAPQRVLYSSQEDGAPLVRARVKALLTGRGISGNPDTLTFAVHKNIDLDSEVWQAQLLADIPAIGAQLLVLDPVRRFAADADKGPAEVRRITAFLRKIVTETGCTVLIVHHDVKPPATGKDERRRAHRASGGDWFASCECPISLETAGETRTLAFPTAYKLSTDPEPFSFFVESDNPKRPNLARLVGEDATAESAADLGAQEKVMAYLIGHKGVSGTAIARALHVGKEVVLSSLESLAQSGHVDGVKSEGRGQPVLWFVRQPGAVVITAERE